MVWREMTVREICKAYYEKDVRIVVLHMLDLHERWVQIPYIFSSFSFYFSLRERSISYVESNASYGV